jgi:hypothetical protein
VKLSELPARANPRPKIYGLKPNGHEDGIVEFDHIDGMYSYCKAFDGNGNFLGVIHLHCCTTLKEHDDGYQIEEPDEERL